MNEEITNLKNEVELLKQIVYSFARQDRFTFQKNIEFFGANEIKLIGTNGLKLGTTVTQKIGFFGATPVVAQAGAAGTADATYSANEVTMINNMYTAMRNYGLLVG